jgi:hypothetical protein
MEGRTKNLTHRKEGWTGNLTKRMEGGTENIENIEWKE